MAEMQIAEHDEPSLRMIRDTCFAPTAPAGPMEDSLNVSVSLR